MEKTTHEKGVLMKESPSERFRRVAEIRTKRLLKEIELLSNLSNKNHYNFSEQEIEKIFSTLEISLKEARYRFAFKRSKEFNL